jgi:hypothetical protein
MTSGDWMMVSGEEKVSVRLTGGWPALYATLKTARAKMKKQAAANPTRAPQESISSNSVYSAVSAELMAAGRVRAWGLMVIVVTGILL